MSKRPAIRNLALLLATMLPASVASAEGFRYVQLPNKPPQGELSEEVAAVIEAPGHQVVAEDGTVVCEIWRAKNWEVVDGFTPDNTVLYSLKPGSLVGVIRFPKQGHDFRQQEIAAGTYTLRYAQQPISGTHVGTFETRDFLVMLSGKGDVSLEPISNEESLANSSAEAIKSGHASVMPLLKASGANPPSVKQVGDKEWWTLAFQGKSGDAPVDLEVIVVGKEGGE